MNCGEPRSEAELLARAEAIAGLTIADLARELGVPVRRSLAGHKGWVGDLLEQALGARAGSRPVPDFEQLGIELKTVPIGARGRPCESTHVCTVPLRALAHEQWETSTVRRKLARVLWIPVDGASAVALPRRRIGRPVIWSPTPPQEQVLRDDWNEHIELIALGRLDELDARLGTYLQVRPKAANSRALTASTDAKGAPAQTLPRGFYLRTALTRAIVGA